ncbi:zinc-binding dehydrogenase [Flavonifractor plautii]|nr:zinc-binding dehydrogenase [Flavonifractor plautii]
MCSSTTTRCSPSATSCPLRRPPLPSPPPARSTAWTASPPLRRLHPHVRRRPHRHHPGPVAPPGGAGRMVIADPHADKLDILRKYGFTDLVVMDKADPSKHTAEIKAIMPKGFDIVIDATGAASVFESCFHFVHMGSKIVAYGVCAADAKVPVSPYDIFSQEYTILGSFAQTHCFGRALEYLESGAVQVKELISHELPLEDYGKGLDYIVQKQARKVIIHP